MGRRLYIFMHIVNKSWKSGVCTYIIYIVKHFCKKSSYEKSINRSYVALIVGTTRFLLKPLAVKYILYIYIRLIHILCGLCNYIKTFLNKL